MDPWARNAPKSEPDVKGCLSVNFPVCSVCQKLEVYPTSEKSKRSMTSKVKEKTDRARTPMMESGGLMRWTWTQSTIGNMSVDSKLVATDGERGRYRDTTVDSGAGGSVVNPDDWPNVESRQKAQ